MRIRAVIFDYGKVLSGPADAERHAELCRMTELEAEEFEQLYWAQPDRRAYDVGFMSGLEYWRRFAERIGLAVTPEQVAALTAEDARMWTTENRVMTGWARQLRTAGVQTAILSNMGDAIAGNIEREQPWVGKFAVRVWSYQLQMGKPDPESYRFVLNRLQRKPQEVLFIDDRPVNVEPARALGLAVHLFTGIEELRQELQAMASEWALPLPEEDE